MVPFVFSMINENSVYKLAIIIPCWNCAKIISELLECVLKQTCQDWRIFCIDDQSTDDTLKVLQYYSNLDNRIHYAIRDKEPKGAQTCRNIGITLTERAEYVIWLDADDLIAPYCFEQRIRYMDKHPELDFGIFPAKSFKDNIYDDYHKKCYGFPFFKDSLGAMLSWTLPMVGWTNIYRRTSIIKYKLQWDVKLLSLQDSDFNIQNLVKGLHFGYAVEEGAKFDYFHRVGNNKNSVSNGIRSIQHFGSHIYLLTKITESLSKDQLIQYDENLKIYFLSFAEILKKDVKYFDKLLEIPWVKKKHIFSLRLKLWAYSNFRFENRLFFRNICSNRDKRRNFWNSKMIEKINEIVK